MGGKLPFGLTAVTFRSTSTASLVLVTAFGSLRAVPVAALFLLSAPPLASQAVLSGVVRDDSSSKPLAGVQVLVEGSSKLSVTDNAGRYVLADLPAGSHVALFRFLGYRPYRARIHLAKGDTTSTDVSMVREPVQQLEPVVTTAEIKKPRGVGGLEGFDERRALGFGSFIDSTELRRYEHRRLADLLSAHAVGFTRFYDLKRRPEPGYYAVSRRRLSDPGTVCPLSIVVDGSTLYTSDGPRHVVWQQGDPINYPVDISMFDVAHLEAVELYRSTAEVPNEFGATGNYCGVLVLWTRRP